MFDFTNSHFQTQATSNFNQRSFSCSTYPLLSVSLSGFSTLLPNVFYLLRIHIYTLLIWWDGIIVINWSKVHGCFIWGLLTIQRWSLNEWRVTTKRLVYEKTTCEDWIKFISDDYLQMYKTLQLFMSLITFNTNDLQASKLLKCMYTYLQRQKIIKNAKLIKAWV